MQAPSYARFEEVHIGATPTRAVNGPRLGLQLGRGCVVSDAGFGWGCVAIPSHGFPTVIQPFAHVVHTLRGEAPTV